MHVHAVDPVVAAWPGVMRMHGAACYPNPDCMAFVSMPHITTPLVVDKLIVPGGWERVSHCGMIPSLECLG